MPQQRCLLRTIQVYTLGLIVFLAANIPRAGRIVPAVEKCFQLELFELDFETADFAGDFGRE